MELPILRGERVTLRPLEDADLDPLAAIIREPSVARWWGESDEPERLRDNLRMDGDAFAIDPNAGNERAIKAYAAVGFKPIGITRRSELVDGEWTDGLFMDLLIEELS